MSQETLDYVKAFGPYFSGFITLGGFIFVLHQLKISARSLKSQARGHLYQMDQVVYKLFVDKPDLRPYFFEDKEPPPATDTMRSEVLATAELLSDLFEHVVHGIDDVDDGVREPWRRHMREMYQKNRSLKAFLDQRASSYSSALLDELKKQI
jgi:hypothetical protein